MLGYRYFITEVSRHGFRILNLRESQFLGCERRKSLLPSSFSIYIFVLFRGCHVYYFARNRPYQMLSISVKVNKSIWSIDLMPDIELGTMSLLAPVSIPSVPGINNPSLEFQPYFRFMSWNREELRVWFSLFSLQLVLWCICICPALSARFLVPGFLPKSSLFSVWVSHYSCLYPLSVWYHAQIIQTCVGPRESISCSSCFSCPRLTSWLLVVSSGLALYKNVDILYRVFSWQHRIPGLLRLVLQSLNYTSPMPLLFHYAFVKISI